jgi:hypothetical protein
MVRSRVCRPPRALRRSRLCVVGATPAEQAEIGARRAHAGGRDADRGRDGKADRRCERAAWSRAVGQERPKSLRVGAWPGTSGGSARVPFQGYKAAFEIGSCRVLAGRLPASVLGKVVHWARENEELLRARWAEGQSKG